MTRLLASIGSVNHLSRRVKALGKAGSVNRCPACGGRGWKFRSFRRSVASAGDAGERALLTRTRIACLACSGHAGPGDRDG